MSNAPRLALLLLLALPACGSEGPASRDAAGSDSGVDAPARVDQQQPAGPDGDGDGVADAEDNCPDLANADQADTDQDGRGDACTAQEGTIAQPLLISPVQRHMVFTEQRDTSSAPSNAIDRYPPSEADETGPEIVYAFRVTEPTRFTAEIVDPEPAGVDIDVHLLSSLEPLTLIERSDTVVYATLDPGTYYLVLDSYKGMVGGYTLDVTFRPRDLDPEETFNGYLLKAVEELAANYKLLGYADAALTHDLEYGPHGTIKASQPPRTMCVAAVLEVVVTAMQIYARETGDASLFDFLPKRSYESLASENIRAHFWVNHQFNARGSGDAARHFGMGMTVPFEELTPGSLINLNRTNGTGHAVIFLSFIDGKGQERSAWSADVVGFKYFSSQGGYDAGSGGFDYRYAVFDQFGAPEMPYKRDTGIIDSDDQLYLNTGMIYAPTHWLRTSWSGGAPAHLLPLPLARPRLFSTFDAAYFNGVTIDDDRP